MTAAFVAITMSLAIHSTGQGECLSPCPIITRTRENTDTTSEHILPPGPGDGWGFPNKSRTVTVGGLRPVSAAGLDRTAEYYFPRYYAVPPEQMFLTSYYNPYETRGQRYLPYVGGGGPTRRAGRRQARPICRNPPTRPRAARSPVTPGSPA